MADNNALLGQQSLCLQDAHSKARLNLDMYHAVRNIDVLVGFCGFQVLVKASSRDTADTAIRLKFARTSASFQCIKEKLFYASLRRLGFFFRLRLGFFSLLSPSDGAGSNGISSLD